MDKMNIIRAKPLFHLLTYTMDKIDNNFDEIIQEYIDKIYYSSNRLEAIDLRRNALEFIDQWRLKNLEDIDKRVRTAGQLILNSFDQYQNKRQQMKCRHRVKQSSAVTSITTIPITVSPMSDSSSSTTMELSDDYQKLPKTNQQIEISIDRSTSSSMNKKISFNTIDFGRDFTFKILANLSSSSSKDMAMTVCENNILIYSQNSNQLIILSLNNSKDTMQIQLDSNRTIRDLCYVGWLLKCLVVTDEKIYLLDYRTKEYDIIESGFGFTSGAVDNHRQTFYLLKESTIYKYNKNSVINLQADQYPIADGYRSQRLVLDNKTNDYLALLVMNNKEKTYILVYSTKSLDNGYLYKIMLDDKIEREWICSNGNNGWLIQGTYPGTCFDLNLNGLASVRVFDCNQIRNIILMNDHHHQHFIIRTNTEIFLLIKNSF